MTNIFRNKISRFYAGDPPCGKISIRNFSHRRILPYEKTRKKRTQKQDRGIVNFMMVSNHFFHSLREWILEMDDPRNQSYITYT